MLPRLLLLNPPVHDFAAYDFWAKPLGLLTLGGALRGQADLALIDALDPCAPWLPPSSRPRRRASGSGKLARTPLPTPALLRDAAPATRHYARYGLQPAELAAALEAVRRPDAVLVTCGMTYWYPGAVEAIRLVRRRWPTVPVVLGGVYATLCAEHAACHSEADHVLGGSIERIGRQLSERLGLPLIPPADPSPAYELAPWADAAALRTSRGCPLRCPYCGVRLLEPAYLRRSLEAVAEEARVIRSLGIEDVALYDDALLAHPARALEVLWCLAPAGLHLHASAGLSPRGLTPEVARAMRAAGFVTIRLGLEAASAEDQRRLGGKVTTAELAEALANLQRAGYRRSAIGVYVMAGLPGQGAEAVERGIAQVHALGARPHLTEYSPVPGSSLFAAAQEASAYPLAEQPLFQNPTLLPCATPDLAAQLPALKRQLRAAARR